MQEERRSIGISGDCEWEYESEAQVCVTVTNTSLDCKKSYDGSYYIGCEVDVDYTISTDYEGDNYLDVEIECKVEIQLNEQYFDLLGSDFAYDDENHSLYSHGFDSSSMSFDFSFILYNLANYDKVTKVKVYSVECEVDSVEQHE